MAGLPSVQRVKLESLKAAEPPQVPTAPRPTPNAVASMSPGPRAPVEAPAAPLDEDAFVVGAQPAQPGVGPSATREEPSDPPPAPRELSPEEKRAEEEKQWKEASPDLYHKYKTLAGVYERAKSDIVNLKTELADLKNEIQQLKQAPPPAPVVELPNIPIAELTEEQRARYEDAFPVIETLSARQAKAVTEQIIAPLTKRLEALESSTERVGVEIKDERENAFVNNVRSRVTDMDKIVRTPEWQDYIAKKAPYTSSTIGNLLVAAHQARDLDTVAEIFAGFKRPANDDINDLITPTASGGAAPVNAQPPAKKILAISHRRKASEDFRKRRISKQDFDRIDAMYKKAESEGRIDYNA